MLRVYPRLFLSLFITKELRLIQENDIRAKMHVIRNLRIMLNPVNLGFVMSTSGLKEQLVWSFGREKLYMFVHYIEIIYRQ